MVEKRKYTSAVAVSLPTELLERVDRDAKRNFDTRSGRISEIVRWYYNTIFEEAQEREEQTGVWGSMVTTPVSRPITTPTPEPKETTNNHEGGFGS